MLARAPNHTFRILHCLRAPLGGLFRHVCDLAEQQTALGHAVCIVCDSQSGDRLTAARIEQLAPHAALGVHTLAMSREIGWRDVIACRQTRALCDRLAIDVVHGHGAKGGAYGRLAARSLRAAGRRVVSIYTPHGGSLHYHPSSAKGRIYMALERRLARMTDCVIFECAYAQQVFSANVGADLTRYRVVYNGLAPADFEPHRPADSAAEFLFVGELRQLKGVDVLIRALAEVRRDLPARAVIVGDGPDAAIFKALAGELGLGNSVDFTGAMPLAKALPRGRVMVIPSRAESFPYIVLEAAAAGIPLLATDVGGISEIVAETDTGLLQADDVAALATAMRATLAGSEIALAKAQRLKARASRAFTIKTMTRGVLDAYTEAAEKLTHR